MRIRLIPTNGDPKDEVIEDIEVSFIPEVGDIIELEYGAAESSLYEVERRRFILDPRTDEETRFSRQIILEVDKRNKPKKYEYDLSKAL